RDERRGVARCPRHRPRHARRGELAAAAGARGADAHRLSVTRANRAYLQRMSKPLIGIGSDVLHEKGERDRAFVYTTYVDSLRLAGAVPVLIPPQPENATELIADLDGILLAGGDDCDPAAYGAERDPSVEPMD